MKDYFGKGKEKIRGIEWDWETFETTKGFPVSDQLLDWVIGQDQALKECYLCLDEWVHKLLWMEKEKWFDIWKNPLSEKPTMRKMIPPGPYLLLMGDPGTGKSLIGRALAAHLTNLYKQHHITLKDVLCWANTVIPSEPRISCRDAGEGKKQVIWEKRKHEKSQKAKSLFTRILTYFMATIGISFVAVGLWWLWEPLTMLFAGDISLNQFLNAFITVGSITFLPAGLMMIFLILIMFMGRMGITGGAKGISGAEQSDAPKLLIDNSAAVAPFIDATGHKSAQLFGSIAWDPLQTGGLGTPEHQRSAAGDVHKANLGILYIDEIKNLYQDEAITLLTVLEEGQLPITLRGSFHGSETAAMAVSTEPVPCLCFLVGAGNFDSVNMIHPALMDRIYGYGKVVRMNNDMPNSIENRRKFVQFIAQESSRFHLKPFTRGAVIELVDEARRRSNKGDALTTKFRPLISILKTAAILAENEKTEFVEQKHVKEAADVHCKTIQRQILEHQQQERGKLLDIDPQGSRMGVTYGLAVVQDPVSGEMTGSVLRVKATMIKRGEKKQGYFKVSGIAKDSKFIQDSIDKVRTVILKKYNVDIAQDYCTHIDFSQAYGVDGPSAGVTMAVLLCSLLEGKPIRQDIAVTGELNISTTDDIGISAIGGAYEKIKAAEVWGFKKVVIPAKNYQFSIDPRDYEIEVLSGRLLEDYMKELLVEDGLQKNGKKRKTKKTRKTKK